MTPLRIERHRPFVRRYLIWARLSPRDVRARRATSRPGARPHPRATSRSPSIIRLRTPGRTVRPECANAGCLGEVGARVATAGSGDAGAPRSITADRCGGWLLDQWIAREAEDALADLVALDLRG